MTQEDANPQRPPRLPAGWISSHSHKYGRIYYFNTQTGESQWMLPLETPQQFRSLEGDSPSPRRGKRARTELSLPGGHPKVAIIVPFRDQDPAQNRAAHLGRYVPHMESFLEKQHVSFHIFIMEQSVDGRKFNRGKLLNAGFDLARRSGCEVFVFHDVDLLPSHNLGRWYSTVPQQPVHIARVWRRYSNNPKYFGGVVAFNRRDYEAINGFPNTFWGWGGEDDEMFSRVEEVRLGATGPGGR
ncbi:unnamed protein product, partial [Discosporangium mesarthrocarpum]